MRRIWKIDRFDLYELLNLEWEPPFAFDFFDMLAAHFFELGMKIIELEAGDILFSVDAIPGDQYADVLHVARGPLHSSFQIAELRAVMVNELA